MLQCDKWIYENRHEVDAARLGHIQTLPFSVRYNAWYSIGKNMYISSPAPYVPLTAEEYLKSKCEERNTIGIRTAIQAVILAAIWLYIIK